MPFESRSNRARQSNMRVLEAPEQQESFANKFLGAFSSGIGKGLASGAEKGFQLAGKRKEQKGKDLADLEKNIFSHASSTGRKQLYEHNPKALRSVYDKAFKLMNNGVDSKEAIRQAFEQHEDGQGGGQQSEDGWGSSSGLGDFAKQIFGSGSSGEAPWGQNNQAVSDFVKAIANPEFVNRTAEERKEAVRERNERNRERNSFTTQHPGKAALSTGLGTVSWLQDLLGEAPGLNQSEEARARVNQAQEKRGKPSITRARDYLREGLTDEQKHAQQTLEFLGSLLPAEKGIELGLQGTRAGIGKIGELIRGSVEGAEAAGVAGRVAGEGEQALSWMDRQRQRFGKGLPAKAAVEGTAEAQAIREGAVEPRGLEGRVRPQGEPTATEMRVGRTNPPQKMFKTGEQQAIREEQIKRFPKIVREIETDAAERAARAAAREPKTVVGRDSMKLRQIDAEKALPRAEESFRKSIARVRALEEEAAKLPVSQRGELAEIINMAKQDLAEAEASLKNAMENLSGHNYRASIQEMKDSARNKMQQIREGVEAEILEGAKPYELSKRDYNPRWKKEAKALSKRKKLPRSKEGDFYQGVHEVYGNEYRARLRELESLPESQRPIGWRKERDILNKMVESLEGERTVHGHKMGLRETAERKRVQDQLAGFRKMQAKPEVRQAAEQKMWKGRLEEIKTPEGRAKVAEEIAQETGKSAEQVEKELGEVDRGIQRTKERVNEAVTEGTTKEAADAGKGVLETIRDINHRLNIPSQVAIGFASALLDEIMPEIVEDFPIRTATVFTLFGKGAIGRGVGVALGKVLIQAHHASEAQRAYRKGDAKKFSEYSAKIRKIAIKNENNRQGVLSD